LTALADDANVYGYTKITSANKDKVFSAIKSILVVFGITDDATASQVMKEALFYDTGKVGEAVSYDKVGCYKVDDYNPLCMRYSNRFQLLPYILHIHMARI
jgi:hypothetical protein